MKIIIAGSGKVGATLTRQLSAEGYDVTLVDTNTGVLESLVEQYDVLGICGNCATTEVLLQAGVEEADLLIAATNADEINLLCCMTAHGLNPNLHTIARIRNPEYSDQVYKMRNIFALSLTVNPEKQTAMEIERLLKYPGFLKRDTFARGRVEIVELRITEDSKLCNAALGDMYGIVKCRVLVCTVLRDGAAITPDGNFVLRAGDRVFVTAPSQELTILLKNLGIITHKTRNVILCGGGRVSYYLAKQLESSDISVRLIESDEKRCVQLAKRLPTTCIIHGDASNEDLLSQEGIAKCDALVTLTGLDELNMIISLYGNGCGAGQVITKLGHTRNSKILNSLALGSIVCPKELCCNTIMRYVRAMKKQTGAALTVHTIADGQAEAVEFLVDEQAPNCGKPLKEIKLRRNVLIACIAHGSKEEIPNGDSVFGVGDTLIVVSSGETVLNQLSDIFE